jgi:hypothetical protein
MGAVGTHGLRRAILLRPGDVFEGKKRGIREEELGYL